MCRDALFFMVGSHGEEDRFSDFAFLIPNKTFTGEGKGGEKNNLHERLHAILSLCFSISRSFSGCIDIIIESLQLFLSSSNI